MEIDEFISMTRDPIGHEVPARLYILCEKINRELVQKALLVKGPLVPETRLC